jgi:S-adenosylmethionine-diacylglycerol 3-amino-3-carboxypropyl transferase
MATTMNAFAAVEPSSSPSTLLRERQSLPGAALDRLFFAQVREDPILEIAALEPGRRDTLVVVSSGGCTALSLLAAGAGHVVAADLNIAQNHLVELKATALTSLAREEALAFLGATASGGESRSRSYREIRGGLTPAAAEYWDRNPAAIRGGVLQSGVSERFARVIMKALGLFVHGKSRQLRLLACRSLEEQRKFYRTEWDTWRWRAFFSILMNRRVFDRTYDPAFFRNVENPSFAKHFLALAERSLTEVPVETNYFLHQMVTGVYPTDRRDPALPPYLGRAGVSRLRSEPKRLTLVDGSYLDALKGMPEASIDGFSLSNIFEWMTPRAIDEHFAEIHRTAARGAVMVFRNFVGWNEVPERWRHRFVEDRSRGELLIERDRSMVQRRIAVCAIHKR